VPIYLALPLFLPSLAFLVLALGIPLSSLPSLPAYRQPLQFSNLNLVPLLLSILRLATSYLPTSLFISSD